MEFTKEQLIERAKKNIEVLRGAVKRIPGASDAAVIHLKLAEITLASLEAEPVSFVMADDLKDSSIISTPAYRDLGEAMERTVGDVVALYAAPPAPVSVPDDVMAAMQKVARIRLDLNDFDGDKRGILDCLGDAEEALIEVVNRRAAMLQGAEPVTTDYKLPANTPCKDAPEHIWLQTAGVWPENGEFSELTWCSDNQHPDDTLYVRADVVPGNSPVNQDGWVACSERMPEEGGRYWCYVEEQNDLGKSHYQWNCAWNGSRWWVEHEDGGRVTHWMPLPAAPQQEVKP